MKQEIVLPKLRVPGQANWLLRGLWIGVMVVSVWVVVLGVQVWRRGSTDPVPSPVATLPPPAPAAPAAPAAATKPAAPTKAAPVGAPGPAAAKPGPSKAFVGKFSGARHRGSRALRGRGAWAKGHGKAHVGGRRALLARKAYLRKKRLHAARTAGRLGGAGVTPPARATAANDLGFPGAGKRTVKPPAKAAKGDPIDDILRNFK